MRKKIDALTQNLALTIVGKSEAIRLVLVALLGGGHALLEDVPGVGKTLLAKSLARSIDGKFQRHVRFLTYNVKTFRRNVSTTLVMFL